MLSKHTATIFETLRKGHFISSNSPNEKIKTLYKTLDDEETFEQLYDYFYPINYILEQGDDYFYFSRPREKNIDLERKINKAFEWIDILDFFKTYDSSFDVGVRFTASEIDSQLKNNADLKNKLKNLKGIGKENKEIKTLDSIKKIIDKLVKDNYISLENELTETYKVLTSFHYLKDLIDSINIPQETENEIPE